MTASTNSKEKYRLGLCIRHHFRTRMDPRAFALPPLMVWVLLYDPAQYLTYGLALSVFLLCPGMETQQTPEAPYASHLMTHQQK